MAETQSSKSQCVSRRDFIKTAAVGNIAMLTACQTRQFPASTLFEAMADSLGKRPKVSFVKIKGDNIGVAVEEALDLLGVSKATTGESVSSVRRCSVRPQMVTWNDIRSLWGVQEIP